MDRKPNERGTWVGEPVSLLIVILLALIIAYLLFRR